MKEGELVFGNEPILRVDAPLAEAQLLETALLNSQLSNIDCNKSFTN